MNLRPDYETLEANRAAAQDALNKLRDVPAVKPVALGISNLQPVGSTGSDEFVLLSNRTYVRLHGKVRAV